MTLLCWAAGITLTVLVFFVLAFVFVRGYSVLSLGFLLEPPRDSMTREAY